MRVVVIEHVSLDGVYQSPAGRQEDTSGGFHLGGWAAARGGDPALAEAMGRRMGEDFAWLLGRRSYDGMLGHWNEVGGPFRDGLNAATKYVASTDPAVDLPWPRSTLLTGDVPGEVAALRRRPGGNLVVLGSGRLVASLLPHGLIDELTLMVHPVVLGSGRRLFAPAGTPQEWRLVAAEPTSDGLLVSTYTPAAL